MSGAAHASPADAPDVAALAETLRGGGVVAVPTDTVYGLAADAASRGAVARVFALKGRPESVALPVLVADLPQALALTAPEHHSALGALAAAFWPGALTVVVALVPGAPVEVGGDGSSVGLRCPAHPAVRALCRAVGPLAVTSANRHGAAPCTTADEVRAVLGADLPVLDGGSCTGSPSTVVALGDPPTLLRAGPVALGSVLEVLEVLERR
ncbi:MAG TPA: L-threonylcarbamoyladenylate synthase [Acidimicrobiales bacterium]|nr:L-threonylcarbamoyladenylate synthase [Acidimicrobiales bacterium]